MNIKEYKAANNPRSRDAEHLWPELFDGPKKKQKNYSGVSPMLVIILMLTSFFIGHTYATVMMEKDSDKKAEKEKETTETPSIFQVGDKVVVKFYPKIPAYYDTEPRCHDAVVLSMSFSLGRWYYTCLLTESHRKVTVRLRYIFSPESS